MRSTTYRSQLAGIYRCESQRNRARLQPHDQWALDSVALDDALWLPREDQLRELLRGTFRSLDRVLGGAGGVVYTVTAAIDGVDAAFASDDPSEAYGLAVLALIRSVRAE